MPDQRRDAAWYPASAFAAACDRWDNWDKAAPPDYRWADHPEYLRDYRPSIEWLMSVDADLCLSAHPSQTRLIDRINADQLVDSSGCRSAAVGILNRLEGILAALTTPRYPL